MTIFMLVYFMGIASCGIQGAQKMIHISSRTHSTVLSAILNSFGGGFIRDIFILSTFPVVLMPECTPDIAVSLMAALSYLSIQQNCLLKNAANWFAIVADAGGLGTFIAIGVDKAIDLGYGKLVAILCGIITSQGGGVIAAVFCGTSFLCAISSNLSYRFMAIGGAVLYALWTGSAENDLLPQYAILLYTTIGALACNSVVINIIKKRLFFIIDRGLLCSVMQKNNVHIIFIPYYNISILYYNEAEIIKPYKIIANKRIMLLYHRMRLM